MFINVKFKNKNSVTVFAAIATIIVILSFVALLITGYCLNIIKLTKCDFEPSYKAEVLRTVGIFLPPVGVIEGYLTIKDGKLL